MTEGPDRRSYVRIDVTMPIVLQLLDTTTRVSGMTINVSPRGAMLASADIGELGLGSKIVIHISWTNGPGKPPRVLRGTGRVAWIVSEAEAALRGWPGEQGRLGLSFDRPLTVES